MKRILTFALLLFAAVNLQVLQADELFWSGLVGSDGTPVEVKLNKGDTYVIEAKKTISEGIWVENKKPFANDACYEFNAMVDADGPKALPIFKSSAPIGVCDGKYHDDHVYKSETFVADDSPLKLWVFDTDYRDNTGNFEASIYKVASATTNTDQTIKKPQVLPPGGYIIVVKNYFPKLPSDMSKETKPAAKEGDPPEQLKPSEWLEKQSIQTLEWSAGDQPMILYAPPGWKNPAGEKKDLTAGLKLSAPASMDLTIKEGTPLNLAGAFLLEVVTTYDSKEDFLKAMPPKPSDDGTPGKEPEILLIDENGLVISDETNDMGRFVTTFGPLELGWSDSRKEENRVFFKDLLKSLGCFVATAVYQSWNAPQLNVLREFRDKVLLTNPAGVRLVGYYYQHGPTWAKDLGHRPYLRAFLKPIISSVSFVLEQINLDSETTQYVFHSAVDWFEWVVSPWTDPKPESQPKELTPAPAG
ncbi:MAG: CFI-box-CTERM domain-containing protein [Chlamydiales bacterium]|nr:CFI-box-CTERM domain-containing protein [Chlamydiales bacterium]